MLTTGPRACLLLILPSSPVTKLLCTHLHVDPQGRKLLLHYLLRRQQVGGRQRTLAQAAAAGQFEAQVRSQATPHASHFVHRSPTCLPLLPGQSTIGSPTQPKPHLRSSEACSRWPSAAMAGGGSQA